MEFEPVRIENRAEFATLLSQRRQENSWLTFGNVFTWRQAFDTQWTRLPEGILIRFGKDGQDFFLPPVLRPQASFARVVVEIANAVAAEGQKFFMQGLSAEMAAEVERDSPEKFVLTAKRDRFDYLYNADDLRNLAGRRYHAKRNYINRFRTETSDWRYEPLTAALVPECLQVAEKWCVGREGDQTEELAHEYAAISEALTHYDELEYLGGAIRIQGKIEAFTLAEKLNADTVVVHIEKADAAITGLFPVINQEFCRSLGPEIKYVNREEDLGNPGLRKAKESYYPVRLVEKYELTCS